MSRNALTLRHALELVLWGKYWDQSLTQDWSVGTLTSSPLCRRCLDTKRVWEIILHVKYFARHSLLKTLFDIHLIWVFSIPPPSMTHTMGTDQFAFQIAAACSEKSSAMSRNCRSNYRRQFDRYNKCSFNPQHQVS